MDFRQLELFLAVIDNASLTRSAEKMNISVGGVSVHLHNLAAELRTELFVKSGKRLVPTPAAMHLADRARLIIRQVRQIEQEFENDPLTDTRPFHFASGATTLIHRLGKPLRMLRKAYPKTTIHVTVAPTEEMAAGLLDRKFDLALISLPLATKDLEIIPLFDEELLILKPSPKRVRGWHICSIQPSEIASQPFLLYPSRSNMRTMINGFFDEIGIHPRVIMEADDTEVIKRLVESGFGCSILPEFALRSGTRFFQTFRIPGRKLIRNQALAMAKSEHPRALTLSMARFLATALTLETLKP